MRNISLTSDTYQRNKKGCVKLPFPSPWGGGVRIKLLGQKIKWGKKGKQAGKKGREDGERKEKGKEKKGEKKGSEREENRKEKGSIRN